MTELDQEILRRVKNKMEELKRQLSLVSPIPQMFITDKEAFDALMMIWHYHTPTVPHEIEMQRHHDRVNEKLKNDF